MSYESGHPSIQIEVETGFLGAGPLKIRFKVDFGPRGTLQSPPGVVPSVSRSSRKPQEAPGSLQRVDSGPKRVQQMVKCVGFFPRKMTESRVFSYTP